MASNLHPIRNDNFDIVQGRLSLEHILTGWLLLLWWSCLFHSDGLGILRSHGCQAIIIDSDSSLDDSLIFILFLALLQVRLMCLILYDSQLVTESRSLLLRSIWQVHNPDSIQIGLREHVHGLLFAHIWFLGLLIWLSY
jgi:hypothetical protein